LRRGHWLNGEHCERRLRRREDQHDRAHLASRGRAEVRDLVERVPLTEGSSRPVSVIVTSAGLARVEQFELRVT
jgi:hypothetical protein